MDGRQAASPKTWALSIARLARIDHQHAAYGPRCAEHNTAWIWRVSIAPGGRGPCFSAKRQHRE